MSSSNLRAEIICENVEGFSEMSFTQNDLISILYNDFLLYAKKNQDSVQILNLVMSLDPNDKRIELVQESNKTFKAVHKQPMKKMHKFKVKLKRKEALRGEILMADLEEIYPNHGYTVEHLIELLYVDCVEGFKKKNNKEVFHKILLYLDHESS